MMIRSLSDERKGKQEVEIEIVIGRTYARIDQKERQEGADHNASLCVGQDVR
jgi:hypothetical protein